MDPKNIPDITILGKKPDDTIFLVQHHYFSFFLPSIVLAKQLYIYFKELWDFMHPIQKAELYT